jgi:hypothetical protein
MGTAGEAVCAEEGVCCSRRCSPGDIVRDKPTRHSSLLLPATPVKISRLNRGARSSPLSYLFAQIQQTGFFKPAPVQVLTQNVSIHGWSLLPSILSVVRLLPPAARSSLLSIIDRPFLKSVFMPSLFQTFDVRTVLSVSFSVGRHSCPLSHRKHHDGRSLSPPHLDTPMQPNQCCASANRLLLGLAVAGADPYRPPRFASRAYRAPLP